MSGYRVFEVPRSILPSFSSPKKPDKLWEEFDDECKRKIVRIDNAIFHKILSKANIKSKQDFMTHHVIYELDKGKYEVHKHSDECAFTIIIYLRKSDTITDKFWVGDKEIKEELWKSSDGNYKAIVFWGNALHNAMVYGKGTREILCFFGGDYLREQTCVD